MTDSWLFVATFAAMLGSAIIGGVFFAFSTFVMRGLGRLPAAHGIAAMQSINITVINPAFMTVFLGTVVVCLLLAGWSLVTWEHPASTSLLAGALLYVIGSFGVTMVFNVPRNNALAKVKPEADDGARVWADYLVTWTAWNHVRTIASLAAAAALTLALRAF